MRTRILLLLSCVLVAYGIGYAALRWRNKTAAPKRHPVWLTFAIRDASGGVRKQQIDVARDPEIVTRELTAFFQPLFESKATTRPDGQPMLVGTFWATHQGGDLPGIPVSKKDSRPKPFVPIRHQVDGVEFRTTVTSCTFTWAEWAYMVDGGRSDGRYLTFNDEPVRDTPLLRFPTGHSAEAMARDAADGYLRFLDAGPGGVIEHLRRQASE